MKMKMKKTIDMNVDGKKKMRVLEDGTEVTDHEDDYDNEDDESQYDQELSQTDQEEFVQPEFIFKDSSMRDPP